MMNSNRNQRVEEIFGAALERPAPARAAKSCSMASSCHCSRYSSALRFIPCITNTTGRSAASPGERDTKTLSSGPSQPSNLNWIIAAEAVETQAISTNSTAAAAMILFNDLTGRVTGQVYDEFFLNG